MLHQLRHYISHILLCLDPSQESKVLQVWVHLDAKFPAPSDLVDLTIDCKAHVVIIIGFLVPCVLLGFLGVIIFGVL